MDATAAIGLACVTIHGLLFAEVVARACVMDRSDVAAGAGAATAVDSSHSNPRSAPVFLVIDTLALALVTLLTLQVCGFARFSNPLVCHALLAMWPAAIANWVVRLVVETDLFSNVAAAVARKETLAMQHATSLRRLGGARCPPPNANARQRSWFSIVCLFENVKTMALSGSARIFRRAMLVCSFADWALLLNVWAAIGLNAYHYAIPSVASNAANAAAFTSAFFIQPSATLALPLAAFVVLDAIRVSSQLLHSCLLIRSRSKTQWNVDDDEDDDDDVALGLDGGGAGSEENQPYQTTGAAAAAAAARFLKLKKRPSSSSSSPSPSSSSASSTRKRGFLGGLSLLPAGMTTRLTQYLYALNLGNVAVAAAMGVTFRAAEVPIGWVNAIVMARFGRLVLECAYLVSTLLARVDRSQFLQFQKSTTYTAVPPHGTSFDLNHHHHSKSSFDGNSPGAGGEGAVDAGRVVQGLSSAIGAQLDIAGAHMDEFITGFTAGLPNPRGVLMTWPNVNVGGNAAAMTLPEFTEAISTGLRGHLAGEHAEAAAEKLFREMAPRPASKAIGLTDIQKWLAAQPSLSESLDGGMSGVGGSGDEDDEGMEAGVDLSSLAVVSSDAAVSTAAAKAIRKEARWRRSVQRVLRRFVRRAEYGRSGSSAVTSATGTSSSSSSSSSSSLFSVSASIPGVMGGGSMGPGKGWAEWAAEAASAAARGLSPPSKRGLRLLSLEGGGIKGLALIWQLRALERAAGRPIHELFDLIGGVSTGGILALGLSRGVPLAQLEEMYHQIGFKVFGSRSTVRQLLKGHAADNTAIEELLVKHLEDLPMIDAPGQLVKCFVVTTQQSERLEVRLIRTYKHPNKGRDQDEEWKQWEAGMATSSAPTVFPPFLRTKPSDADGAPQVFIDGALSGYNNPSSLLLNEGLDLAEKGQQIDVLLSLGCGEVPNGAAGAAGGSPNTGGSGSGGGGAGVGLLYWVGQVVNLAFDVELQEAHVASLIQRFSPQTMHVRLNPPTGGYGLTEHRPDLLAKMEDETRQYLAENRMVFAELAAALTANVPAVPSTNDNDNNNDNNGGGDDGGGDSFRIRSGIANNTVEVVSGGLRSADAASAVSSTLNHALSDGAVTGKNWFDSECEVFFTWDDEEEDCVGKNAHGQADDGDGGGGGDGGGDGDYLRSRGEGGRGWGHDGGDECVVDEKRRERCGA